MSSQIKIEKQIRSRFNQLEDSKQRVLDSLATINSSQINRFPAPGQWSIGQILYHMYVVEHGSLAYMKKKIQGIDNLKPTLWKASFKLKLTKIVFKTGVKFKAPERAMKDFPQTIKFHELIDDWGKTRAGMKQFVEDFPIEKLKFGIFRHPVIGLINIIQTLKFYQFHFDRHEKQIQQLLRQSGHKTFGQ